MEFHRLGVCWFINNSMLLPEQKRKWEELDTFFKNNSKYYKQLDNNEITFFVYPCGTGGNFLSNLFLDVSEIPVKTNNNYPGPPLDKINSLRGYNDFVEPFLLKYIDVTVITNMEKTDEDIFNNLSSLNNTTFIISHSLPIIPYFYYKNSKKIKTIYINNTTQKSFTQILCSIKNNFATELIDNILHKKCKASVAKKLKPIIEKQIAIVDDNVIKNILVDYLSIPTNHNFVLESNPNELTKEIIKVLTNLFNEIPLPPTYSNLSLLEVFPGKLAMLDYENLFFNNEDAIIQTLMDVFKSKNMFSYYKKEIKSYHEKNLELVAQFKNSLLITIDKLNE